MIDDVMQEVERALSGPLTPTPDHPLLAYFEGLETRLSGIAGNPQTLANLHHGIEILKLSTHFDYANAYTPEDAKKALHAVMHLYAQAQVQEITEALRGGGFTQDQLRDRMVSIAGMGTLAGYLTRCLEVDGRWPTP